MYNQKGDSEVREWQVFSVMWNECHDPRRSPGLEEKREEDTELPSYVASGVSF